MTTEERLESLEEKVDKIKDALLGNDYNQGSGFIQRQNQLEKRVEEIEKRMVQFKWFLFGVSTMAGVGIKSLFSELMKYFN